VKLTEKIERLVQVILALGSILGLVFVGLPAFNALLAILALAVLVGHSLVSWPSRRWRPTEPTAEGHLFRSWIVHSHTAIPILLTAIMIAFVSSGLAERHLPGAVQTEARRLLLSETPGNQPGPIVVAMPDSFTLTRSNGTDHASDSAYVLVRDNQQWRMESLHSVTQEMVETVAEQVGSAALTLLLGTVLYGFMLPIAETMGGKSFGLVEDA
jgi:hypothetical protein